MKLPFLNIFLLASLLGGFGHRGLPAQQEAVEFRNVKVQSNYPEGITFRIEICGRTPQSDVAFHYTTSKDATQYWGWTEETWTLDEGQTSDNCDKRKFYLETKEFEIPLFSQIKYYWSVEQNDKVSQSPHYIYYNRDASHDWKTLENRDFVILWHDRPAEFADEVMSIALMADQDQSKFYSLILESPITIVITNTEEEFDAWRAGDDYAWGMAFDENDLTIQYVPEDSGYRDWLYQVIPHEISHIYVGHLVERYSHVPHWLSEGLAKYQEYSDHRDEWFAIKEAYNTDGVRSLSELEDGFGDEETTVYYAYAEGYYAVLYMGEEYGPEALSTLLYEFGRGSNDDAAFFKAFGVSPIQFDSDYLVWLEKRIETAPPDTGIRKHMTVGEINRLYFLLVAMCTLPLCFIVLGAGMLVTIWKVVSASSAKEKMTR